MVRRIVLLGHSLAIDSIAAAIGALPELEVFYAPDASGSTSEVASDIIARTHGGHL